MGVSGLDTVQELAKLVVYAQLPKKYLIIEGRITEEGLEQG